MNEFIPVLDMLEASDYVAQRKLKDELFDLEHKIKQVMDAGLSSEDMETAKKVYAAAQVASSIFNKISL